MSVLVPCALLAAEVCVLVPLPSHPAAAICPDSIASRTAMPRRPSSATAWAGAASLTHTTFSPASRPSLTNAAVRSNSSSASPKVRQAWSSADSSVT